jgi:hypothetical protein
MLINIFIHNLLVYCKSILEDIVGVFNEKRFGLGSVDSIKLGLQLLDSPAKQVHLQKISSLIYS